MSTKYLIREQLEAAAKSMATTMQKSKIAMLEASGWKISSTVTNAYEETGVFLVHPDGRHTLCPPTADARCITAAKSGTIHYNMLTWERN